ncbi:MAG: retroviral-like aspartic protease family protein [Synergistaceae bacterium]|nr:retroviral-like aspartic protease family protein [Synergistaceae bacterium]
MPSFTAHIANLQSLGPILEVGISVHHIVANKLKEQGKSAPIIRVAAMIDTGATSSAITPEIVKKLGIFPVGRVNIKTPSHESFPAYQYHIVIALPNDVLINTTEVIEVPLAGQHIQCLIGRDILKYGVLIYNGYSETVTFSI